MKPYLIILGMAIFALEVIAILISITTITPTLIYQIVLATVGMGVNLLAIIMVIQGLRAN